MVTTLLALLSTAAWAEEPVSLGIGAGFDLSTNDPFVSRAGARVDVHVAVGPLVEFTAQGVFYPVLGEGGCDDPDWTALSCQLIEENSVSPDISRLTGRGTALLTLWPLRGGDGDWSTGVGFSAGWGVVTTTDDLVALQAEGVPEAEATAEELHTGPAAGMVGEVRNERVGFRLGLTHLAWVETVKSTTMENKSLVLLAAGVDVWF